MLFYLVLENAANSPAKTVPVPAVSVPAPVVGSCPALFPLEGVSVAERERESCEREMK